MLASVDSLKKDLLNLKPSENKLEATRNFVQVIANYMNHIQAGPTGSPGILAFNSEAMATAWLAGIEAAVIKPGTVELPIWTASELDVATLPLGATTILTASVAQTLLATLLNLATQSSNPPVPMATAFKAAAGACVFNCIGIAVPGVPTPVPIPGQ
jgi:hypothetical protein